MMTACTGHALHRGANVVVQFVAWWVRGHVVVILHNDVGRSLLSVCVVIDLPVVLKVFGSLLRHQALTLTTLYRWHTEVTWVVTSAVRRGGG